MKMFLYLTMLLFFLMSAIGGERGIKSFFTLCINALIGLISIYFLGFSVPAGIVMLGSTILFSVSTIFFQNGWNVKTKTTMIACILVLILLGTGIAIFLNDAHVIGFQEIDLQNSDATYLATDVTIQIGSVWFLSFLWSLLGALIDTSIAISSALYEVFRQNEQISRKTLSLRGLKIGEELIGTMINTLMFVALGESIMLIFYYENYQYPIYKILNSKSLLQDVSMVLFSCMSCALILPVTVYIFVYLIKKETMPHES